MVPLVFLPGLGHLPLAFRPHTGYDRVVRLTVVDVESEVNQVYCPIGTYPVIGINLDVSAVLQGDVYKWFTGYTFQSLRRPVPGGFQEEFNRSLARVNIATGRKHQRSRCRCLIADVRSSARRTGKTARLTSTRRTGRRSR